MYESFMNISLLSVGGWMSPSIVRVSIRHSYSRR